MKSTTKGMRGLGKHILACVCSLALATALVPAAALSAFAADGAAAEEATVLTVQIKDADTGAVTTPKGWDYTQSELEALAAQNTEPVNYLSGAKGGRVYTSTSYVKIDQLVGGTVKWASGASLEITASDGLSNTPTYDDLAVPHYFYPDYTISGKEGTNAVETSPALCLTTAYTALEGTMTAQDAVNNNLAQEQSSTMTWFEGLTSAAQELPSGMSSLSNITTITVVYPHSDFTILAKNLTTGETAQVASVTNDELSALAESKTKSFMLSMKGSTGVFTTTIYVTLDSLLDKYAKDYWKAGSEANIAAPDAFSTDLSYEDANATQYFYPNYTGTEGSSLEGAVATEPVVALSYSKNAGYIGTDGSTAGDVETSNLAGEFTTGTRFFKGVADISNIPAGNTAVTNCDTITISYTPVAAQTIKVSPASKTLKAGKSATFKVKGAKTELSAKAADAKSRKALKVSVKGAKATVKVKSNAKKGTYKVTVKAKASAEYKASNTKTITVKVK